MNMTKRINLLILFVGVIFFSCIFIVRPADAGCQSPNLTCSGTIVSNPGIENTCLSDEVWCEPAPATFPTGDKQPNGYTCADNSDCQSNNCNGAICEAGNANTKRIGDICNSGDECPSGVQCRPVEVGATTKTCQLVNATTPPTPTPGGGGAATGDGWSLNSISGFGLPDASISGIVKGILVWLLGGLGIIGVIGFTISGIMYLISAGDEGMIEKAKEAMKYSIMGVIVGLIGVVVIQAIDWMLRGFSNF